MSSEKSLKNFKKYSFLIGFVILAAIINRLNFTNIYTSLRETNLSLVIVGIIFLIPVILIKAWRWNYLKKIQGINYKFWDSFIIYQIGLAIGSVTPGQIGELIKIYYLKTRCSIGKSLVSILVDRFMDVFYLIIVGYFGIIIYLREVGTKLNIIYIFLLFSLILIIFGIHRDWHKKIGKFFFNKLMPLKYQMMWEENFSDFLNDLKLISINKYLNASILTVLGWLAYYFQVYILTLSIGLEIPLMKLALALTAVGLLSLLPISFLGIGTREAALILILKPFADIPAIIIFSQLILLTNIFSILMGLVFLKIRPLPFKIKNYEPLEK